MNEENSIENRTSEGEECPKKIEVITGDGGLNISPVHKHLEVEKPKPKENRKIFIPEVKENPSNSNTENESENTTDEN